jgi:hypothetical protein
LASLFFFFFPRIFGLDGVIERVLVCSGVVDDYDREASLRFSDVFLKDFLFGVCVLEDLLSFDFRSSLQCLSATGALD